MTIKEIAHQLELNPRELEKESVRIYLTQRLHHVETEVFRIGLKHGVKNIWEMDRLIKKGKIHENNSWEDFFILDSLEAERNKIKSLLSKLK